MARDDDSLNTDSKEDIKYLLGNMGIEILLAIDRGARDFKTIQLFTGCSMSCIKGRIPVLLEIDLIHKNNNEYFLTEKGINFKRDLEIKS